MPSCTRQFKEKLLPLCLPSLLVSEQTAVQDGGGETCYQREGSSITNAICICVIQAAERGGKRLNDDLTLTLSLTSHAVKAIPNGLAHPCLPRWRHHTNYTRTLYCRQPTGMGHPVCQYCHKTGWCCFMTLCL